MCETKTPSVTDGVSYVYIRFVECLIPVIVNTFLSGNLRNPTHGSFKMLKISL